MTKSRKTRGFTLIEMMIVISIMLILISIAVPIYSRSIVTAREAVLRQDLYSLRQSIDMYTMDKQKGPQSLDDLVSAGYLRQIPEDPFTRQRDWQTVEEDVILDPDQTEPGITDVHSSSPLVGTNGVAYSQW